MNQVASARPLQLTAVSRDTLSSRNVLCRNRAPFEVQWLGLDWLFNLGPAPAPVMPANQPRHYVECDWGGARVVVGIDRSALERLAAMAMPGAEPSSWPVPVLLAALEVAASALTEIVEGVSRKSLRIVSIAGRPDVTGLEAYGWSATSRRNAFEGELLLDATAGRFLATALREQPFAAPLGGWNSLPIRVRLMAGWVDLSTSALRSIAQRDVVVLDECLLSAGDRLLVLLGPRLGVPCELQGSALQVLEGVQEIMADIDDSVAAGSGLIDDVPVRVTFDLGEREIPLGDLRSLQPGYLFNLGRDPRNTVSIRANGRLIGEGELVDIEGRVGVSVLRFTLDAE
ncbi:MAG: YscQ/HrcQ family type III secretion apparatus protein [Comamonadaceae bacterium]|nr:MAG: YscQ/HrcQ family type III secretion apparatus protein [Comamonadaceae bacterium]